MRIIRERNQPKLPNWYQAEFSKKSMNVSAVHHTKRIEYGSEIMNKKSSNVFVIIRLICVTVILVLSGYIGPYLPENKPLRIIILLAIYALGIVSLYTISRIEKKQNR